MKLPIYLLAASVMALGLIAAACESESSGQTTESAPASAPAGTTGKLSANDASRTELAAAFEAAGIGNAAKWAREVEEYRPYSVDDTDFNKLRGELAKYNPGPGVADSIVALLELP